MKKIEAILFDFGGTLDGDGVDWFRRFHVAIKEQGCLISEDDFARYAIQAANEICLLEDTKRLRMDQTAARLLERIYVLARAEHGKRGSGWDPGVVVDGFMAGAVRCFDRNRKVLLELRKRYRLGVISNNWGNTSGWCEQFSLDGFFETMIDSTAVGAEKPEAAIFEAALAELNLPAAVCAYVGDRYECDVVGSQGAGMTAIWITNDGESEQGCDLAANYRIKRLSDLLDIDWE